MKKKIPRKLLKLYKKFDSCRRCEKENNFLRHVLGGGKFRKPQFFFLFINPTHLNISSHKNYDGKRRYPFIGVRYFYHFLSEAEFVSKEMVNDIYKRGWRINDEERIEQSLIDNRIYMTNLVKCTQSHPQNPQKEIIREDFPLLQEEIDIVSPKYIIAFGRLPFKIITGNDICLRDCLKRIKKDNFLPFKSTSILGKRYDILPCYFPVGRGSPGKALEILRYIKRRYSD